MSREHFSQALSSNRVDENESCEDFPAASSVAISHLKRKWAPRLRPASGEKMPALHPCAIFALAILMIPIIAIGDKLTGIEISLTLFYVVPVAIAAWFCGLGAGLFAAMCCAIAALISQYLDEPKDPRIAILFWNTGMRLGVFMLVAILLAIIRNNRDNLRVAVEDKTRLLRQEIAERKQTEREFFRLIQRHRDAVAFELHDGLAQFLTAVAMKTKRIERQLSDGCSPHREPVQEIVKLLNRAVGQTREIAHGLSPMEGVASELFSAVRRLASDTEKTFGVRCETRSSHAQLRYSNDTNVHLFRIVQQSIDNALSHGHAKSIQITFEQDERDLRLTIKDDGDGFDPATVSRDGLGLRTMALRADIIDGHLDVFSQRGQGTRIQVTAELKNLLRTVEEGAEPVTSAEAASKE